VIAGTPANSMNWLSQFIKAHNGNAVWVTSIGGQAGRPDPGNIIHVSGVNAARERAIQIRFRIHTRIIEVSRHRLSEWLKLHEADPVSIIDGLFQHHGAQASRATLAAGTGVAGGARERTINIPVPLNSPLEEDLFARTPVNERPAVTATVIPFKPTP